MPTEAYPSVPAAPVKSFFVSMLTRDIRLEDAILDLLDNCVDGVIRSKGATGTKPFKDHWAHITFDRKKFVIEDNCGGIPWELHDYAFRMGAEPGRKPEKTGTLGVYGIGLKRALFKMGQESTISTQSGKHAYIVGIPPTWIDDEKKWDLPVVPLAKRMPEDGTRIEVTDLHDGIAGRFDEDKAGFNADLEKLIATHYAYIIDKGFQVTVNEKHVRARGTKILFSGGQQARAGVNPYIFQAQQNGVSVFLAVGFTRPIPSKEEAEEAAQEMRRSSSDAGWTVLCNERAVIYCDKTEMTGWGEAAVPRYHTQFIAISGVVSFRAANAMHLPTTTTKRGIDGSSSLYLRVKNKMREGMKLFTGNTNKWKERTAEAKAYADKADLLSLEELQERVARLTMKKTDNALEGGAEYWPTLPEPKKTVTDVRRILFTRKLHEIQAVAEHLTGNPGMPPNDVGSKCFDEVLKEAGK